MIETKQDQLDQERATDEGMPERQSKTLADNPSWEKIWEYTDSLTEMIREFDPDIIVGIQRGGIIPAAMLAYKLGKPIASIEVVKDGKSRKVGESVGIDWHNINGLKTVIVEDRFETGRSAKAGMDKLTQHGAEVRLACYATSDISEIEPHYVLQRNVEKPSSYPWESRS